MNILDTFHLTPLQSAAVTENRDIAVSAGAGSGKTNTLTARFVRYLDQDTPPRRIAAVTFTDKATREMRNRIRAHIHTWLTGDCPPGEQARWRTIEADLDAARIGTIHALCAEILRAHPAEAGIDPRFGVLDEGLADAFKAQAVEDSLAWATGQDTLAPLFAAFPPNVLSDILSELVKHRLEAGTAFAQESSNTVLRDTLREFLDTPRVREAWHTLRALADDGTLVEDAGDKLASQVEGLLAQWDALERALRENRAGDAAKTLFLIRRQGLRRGVGKKTSAARASIDELQAAYDDRLDPWLGGANNKDPEPDPALDARVREMAALLRVLFEHAENEYQQSKDQLAALDFDDMERGAQTLLERPEIRTHWQAQLDTLLVDEFQDTNERQRKLIEALAGSQDALAEAGDPRSMPIPHSNGRAGRLFIVGDPKQSIYRFRGADVTVFTRVRDDIAARGGLPVDLTDSFRAHTELIETLNRMLARVMDSAAPRRSYYTPFARLNSSRTKPPRFPAPFVEFLLGMGDDPRRTAAQLLAARLRELHDGGISWEEVVCLFRASTGFDDYENAFGSAGIPFVTVAGRGFYERPEIRDLLNLLRALADPNDDLAMAGLLRSPAFGLSDPALYRLRWGDGPSPRAYYDALHGNLSGLPEPDRERAAVTLRILQEMTPLVGRVSVAELIKTLLGKTHYLALLAAVTGERLQRNVEKLLTDAYASGLTNVTEFLEYIETLRDVGAREGEAPSEAEGAVRLMTVHKAKGLQFPVVVLADAARARPPLRAYVLLSNELGVVPRVESDAGFALSFALAKGFEQDRAQAEDLRLLYVAATRAQEKLIVCAHQVNRTGVWFRQLTGAANLTPDDVAAEPNVWHECALPDAPHKISWFAADGTTPPAAGGEGTPPPEQARFPADPAPLYEPLPGHHGNVNEEDEPSLEEALEGETAGKQLGDLFHAAIRQWCFPGDPMYEALIHASSAAGGETPVDLAPHVGELLERLRRDARWRDMNDAPVRRHEVPFIDPRGDVGEGRIDLLYRAPAGAWQIVEFKTERIARAELQDAVVRHRVQALRYRRAARRAGLDAEAWLCFLDCEGGVEWEQAKDGG